MRALALLLALAAGAASAEEPKLPLLNLNYRVSWNGISLGEALITLTPSGTADCYRYESVTNPVGVFVLNAVFWLGWGLVLLSTFLINHFELFGLRQVWARLRGRTLPQPVFRTPFLYKRVRHPLYLGFLLAFWSTPTMTAGHLLFAVATTGYILIAIWFEERDLVALFGDQYRRYRQQVSMLIPLPGRKVRAEIDSEVQRPRPAE